MGAPCSFGRGYFLGLKARARAFKVPSSEFTVQSLQFRTQGVGFQVKTSNPEIVVWEPFWALRINYIATWSPWVPFTPTNPKQLRASSCGASQVHYAS